MEDLIKSYEERETTKAHQGLRSVPGQQSVDATRTCQASPSSCHLSDHTHSCPPCASACSPCTPPHCSSRPLIFSCHGPRNQPDILACKSCSLNKPGYLSENDTVISSLNDLKRKVDKIEGELIDVVNHIEAKDLPSDDISNSNSIERRPSPSRPSYQNPAAIPAYDLIEVVEVAEVHAADDSIVSTDEFVPGIEPPASSSSCLNYNPPTSHP